MPRFYGPALRFPISSDATRSPPREGARELSNTYQEVVDLLGGLKVALARPNILLKDRQASRRTGSRARSPHQRHES